MNNFIKKITYLVLLTPVVVPFLAQAQAPGNSLGSLFTYLIDIFRKQIIPLIILLIFVYILFIGLQIILTTESSEKRDERKKQLFWGIIGLFTVSAIFGLLIFVQNSLGIFSGGTLSPIN